MKLTKLNFWYLILDFLTSYIGWLAFYVIRKTQIEKTELLFTHREFWLPALIALFWVSLFAIIGLYKETFKRSRLKEVISVFQMSLIGSLIIFFITFLDDPIQDYKLFRTMLLYYFLIEFLSVSLVRFVVSTSIKRQIIARKIHFPTIIIGNGATAFQIWDELQRGEPSLGYKVLGYISLNSQVQSPDNQFWGKVKRLGDLKKLEEVIQKRKIQEIIIALDNHDHAKFLEIINKCHSLGVTINVVPDMYDIMVGNVKMMNVFGSPLMEIYPEIMAPWEQFVKRSMDIAISILVLIILSPMYLLIAIIIKLDSKGPVFFLQERIGIHGKPFQIIKFRSMYTDAEKFGPSLSRENDPRITRIGKFLRKTRLDEFPQFYNVLIGDMSIVGPRPERQFFIDQIVQKAPHYVHLHKVRPGITSWGQVKYGYAENVDQMIERLKYDILYIENMSLLLDLKIIVYTVLIVIEGRGK